jgi:uncharacterized repeat protein (TIGR01451 family)
MNNITLLYNALGCWRSQSAGALGRTSRCSLPTALRAVWAMVLAALVWWTPPAQADEHPVGCSGSALGINLFTDARDVHIGETIPYSVTVFNGLAGSPKIACDATGIVAAVVTPDGKTNFITLRRTSLVNGDADFYPNVVTYVVRAQDILPDGTVRATAFDDGAIHQNDTDSRGGGFQGLNSEVIQPNILVTAVCVGSTGENGLITINGTVRNTGNAPLNSVTVSNAVNGTTVLVLGPISLPVGGSSNFTTTYVPLNPCVPSVAVVTASGTDTLTVPRTVTSSATTTCSDVLTPAIQVTKVCPTTPVRPGQQLVYSGTVANVGDVTLTNVTVVADQPAPNTVIFTVASLAPGAVRTFTGSYLAPTNCSTTSGVLATGTSLCGVQVSSTASSACPILTTPQIRIAALCSTNVIHPGGAVSYSGTVSNTGDVALKNVAVVSDQPAPNTTVFTVASLAPGASASFSGSYTAPADACTVTANLVASGSDLCTAQVVNQAASAICTVTPTPQIAVTLACPTNASAPGAQVIYTGTVSNTGDVTLNNVTVTDSQATPPTVFTVASLAPGASANFTASFLAPTDACSVSTTVTASGSDRCSAKVVTATQSATCPLITAPGLVVTQGCPATPAVPGALLSYSGTVKNSGNVTLTNVVVLNSLSGTTPIFTAATLAPGATANFTGSYLAPTNCASTSTSTATATSVCGVAVTNSASSTCTVLTAPQILITAVCSTNTVLPGGTATYGGTVKNTGNITLTNVTVISDRPAANTTVFTVATLAPGAVANFTGTYTVPADACSLLTTLTGTALDICTRNAVTNAAPITCSVTTAPQLAVTLACPPATAAAGGPVIYTGTVKNTGNVTLNNVTVTDSQATPPTVFTVASLAPGASSNFTVNLLAPADSCSVSTTVTASGTDSCSARVVTATQSATCPLLTAPGLIVTESCPTSPASPGALLTYSGTVKNTGNVTLTNVVVTDDRSGPVVPPGTMFWVDDDLPAGAQGFADHGDSFNFITANPTPYSGTKAHKSNLTGGLHQHGFNSATATLAVQTGDIMVAYIYLDPATLPTEVMLQWGVNGDFSHRAFWGADAINAGTPGTASRRNMGPLPATGQWVRLEVPANLVGLENTVVSGIVFTLLDGQATWDATGKSSTPAPVSTSTTVFTVATLAPGATASFTGSFTVPTNGICSVTTTLNARGADKCTGQNVTATTTSTCPLLTAPAIEVTQTCPATAVLQGSLLTYTGTVKNTGNITLTNVVVTSDRPATNTAIFTVATLAPGESRSFSGSYKVPLNCCVVSSTVAASGQGCDGVAVTDSMTRTCTVFTSPAISVTKVCTSDGPLKPGDLLTYSGTVSNTGNITLVNVTVVDDQTPGNPPVPGPLTLAPGESYDFTASYVVPPDFCGTDTVTARGLDVCTLLPVSNSATATCPVTTTPRISVVKNCPLTPTPRGGLYTYTGTVSNHGDVTLDNVFVVDDQPTNGTPVIGPLTLAPGASVNFTNSYVAPHCCCLIIDTLSATGKARCSGVTVKATATTVCPLLSNPGILVSKVCPSGTVPAGGLYQFSGSVRNTGDVVLTNVVVYSSQPAANTVLLGPIELAPGETVSFSGSYTVAAGSNPATDTVKASGTDTCGGHTVTSTANCAGPVNSASPVITSITITNGRATVSWQATPGTTYTLQGKASPEESWTTIPGTVTANGNSASQVDTSEVTRTKLYRVITQE